MCLFGAGSVEKDWLELIVEVDLNNFVEVGLQGEFRILLNPGLPIERRTEIVNLLNGGRLPVEDHIYIPDERLAKASTEDLMGVLKGRRDCEEFEIPELREKNIE